eukprot:TRINITY_DN45270_c0_g1_i1.p1 TRINITY_DN45270_c0_g1~~TRINITY_DN45270_c0_g1_i1.p1  ORF type:complete len:507 (-),score=24.64 TRINITY_DN45270_c0_g1_i1:17-1537(-)
MPEFRCLAHAFASVLLGVAVQSAEQTCDDTGECLETNVSSAHVQQSGEQEVEPALKNHLEQTASRMLRDLLPRAHTSTCRDKIQDVARSIKTVFKRSFPRHEHAEANCPFTLLAPQQDGSQASHHITRRTKHPVLDALGSPKCSATLAFLVQLTHRTKTDQLERLLKHIMHEDHVYHVVFDSYPDPPSENASISRTQYLTEFIRRETQGKVMHLGFSQHDAVYTGASVIFMELLALRELLQPGVPRWDFVINLSGEDYPIRSVNFMARYLAKRGAISWTESFLQSPFYSNGRALHDWFLECPDEPCNLTGSTSNTLCRGYVFWLRRSRKPPMALSTEFSGSQWWVLHRDFIEYTLNCLRLVSGSEVTARSSSGNQAADTAFCESLRGIYSWYETSWSPEESFVQTALYNGPYCDRVGRGNLKWVSWSSNDHSCYSPGQSFGGDYTSKRPGCITRAVGPKAWHPECSVANTASCDRYSHQLFARKFAWDHDQNEPLNIADRAREAWD